ncbi:MAG: hypothetical protein O3A01_07410, partial [bacterium]|nr:hypothetical protein [bacterium]
EVLQTLAGIDRSLLSEGWVEYREDGTVEFRRSIPFLVRFQAILMAYTERLGAWIRFRFDVPE